MLNGTLALHDVRDVESFCARILQAGQLDLGAHDEEDLLAYLIETAWKLSTDYNPGGIRFSTWARATLQKRIIDWQRQRFGRTTWTAPRSGATGKQYADSYQRPRPALVSFDDPAHADLGDALPTPQRDPAAHGDPSDLVRLLRTRSSDEAWRHDRRRKTLPHRAA